MLDNGETLQSEVLATSPVAVGAQPAIDHTHLRRFTMGDVQLEHEVLVLFANELPITLAGLKGAVTDRDWKIAAHTLKGSARTVGAWRVAAAAVNAERDPNVVYHREDKAQVVSICEQAIRDAVVYIAGLPRPE